MVPPLLHSVIELEPAIERLSAIDLATANSVSREILEYTKSIERLRPNIPTKPYGRALLLELVLEYAISEYGREQLLCYLLTAIACPEDASPPDVDFAWVLTTLATFNNYTLSEKESIAERTVEIADHLVNGFFAPLRAASGKTPQPTPHLSSSKLSEGTLVSTKHRLSALRKACLTRDQYKCVISRAFDQTQYKRLLNANEQAKDYSGEQLKGQARAYLEVAHILPHSLISTKDSSEVLTGAKAFTLQILNMFDPGIVQRLEGENIDRTYNALSLRADLHKFFGNLEIYFEAEAGAENTYIIKFVGGDNDAVSGLPVLPVTRKLLSTPDRTSDLPLPRLLAIHRACCLILYLSGAGDYIENLLDELETSEVKSDGTSNLAAMVDLRLRQAVLWDKHSIMT